MNNNARIRLIVVLMFLTMGGLVYYAYTLMQQNVSGLVKTVKESTEPDLSLVRIKELWSNITNTSNNIRAYTVTHDKQHLVRFPDLKESVKSGLDSLKDDAVRSGRNIDRLIEIERLLNRKMDIYDRLLEINYNRVLTGEIQKLTPNDSIIDTLQVIQEQGNLFQRMFSSKYSRKTIQSRADSLISERNQRLQNYRRDVNRIREEEDIMLKEQTEREVLLLETDKLLTLEIESLIKRLESAEQSRLRMKAAGSQLEAVKAAATIRRIVFAGMGVIAVLLFFVLRDIEIANRRRKELLAAKKHAENLARAKEEFMSTMSHEIRTPLTSVIGFSEKLRNTKLDETQLRYMKAINGSSEHLLSIVNDVLDFTRVDSGKLKFQSIPFKASDIFTEVYDAMFWKAQEKKIELRIYIQPIATLQLHGDPVRLRQVLFNLVGNAIKFTEKGNVDITATFVEENENATLLFKVSDTGIGIPRDRLDAIFSEFEQADVTTERKYGGSGLGLSITKRIVDQLGGTVKVESNPGLGSVFSVRIPYAHGYLEPRETSYSEEAPPLQPLEGLTILLAEDDPMIRELQYHSLETMGARVIMAENGKDALDQFQKNKVSLILMDIQMPELSGPEVLKIIRTEFPPDKKDIPVIAMTANVLQHDLKRWMDEGMNDFITKPFKESELIEKIEKLLHPENTPTIASKPPDPIPQLKHDAVYAFNLERPEKMYNLDELIETSQGNMDFVRKMINLFLTSSFASVNNLKFHLKQNNWEQVAKTAHRMIGSYKQMGIDYVAAMLKELEETATGSRELGKAAYLVNETEKYSNEVFQLLKKELELFSTNQTL